MTFSKAFLCVALLCAGCTTLPVPSPAPRAAASTLTERATRGTHGRASYYTCCARTANGERFRPDGLTAAHRTLRFGTRVRVTNKANNRSVIVRINDRGPFVRDKMIDLSRGAARQIRMINSGTARVVMEVLK